MATGVDIIAFSLFLLLSFVFALLKAFSVVIAGQVVGTKCLGYIKAVGYFLLIFIGLSILKALVGTIYLHNIWLAILDIAIFMSVMCALLPTYQVLGIKKRIIYFVVGLLLNLLMMFGLFYLVFSVQALPFADLLPR